MGVAFGQTCLMRPSGPMRYATRTAVACVGASAAPYFTPSSRFVSDKSGYVKPNFSANFLLSWTLSKLAPRMAAFFAWMSFALSRRTLPWIVQPGVSAFG